MDQQPVSVKSLANFPAEIIGLILAYDDILHMSMELWKCGSKVLQYKLARSVTRVSLHCERTLQYGGIPKYLAELGQLTSLSLSRGGRPLYRPKEVLEDLKKLNRGLLELDFNVANSGQYLFPKYRAPFPEQEMANFNAAYGESVGYHESFEESVDMREAFPLLERLSVQSRLCPRDVEYLPTGLKHLSCSIQEGEEEVEFMKALSARSVGLESLSTGRLWRLDQALFSSLPRSLTWLDVSSSSLPLGMIQPSLLESLPRGLRVLKSESLWGQGNTAGIVWSPAFLEALPPALEDIRILRYLGSDADEKAIASWLTRRGKAIKAFGNSVTTSKEISPLLLASLPSTLTSLNGRFPSSGSPLPTTHLRSLELRPVEKQFSFAFPPLLTSLNLNNACFDLNPQLHSIIMALPLLQSLYLDCNLTDTYIDLPPRLTRLSYFANRINATTPHRLTIIRHRLEEKSKMEAKKSTSLTPNTMNHTLGLNANTTQHLPSLTQEDFMADLEWPFATLPSTLTELTVKILHLPASSLRLLSSSPHLTSLKVGSLFLDEHFDKGLTVFDLMPRSLTKLDEVSLYSFSDHGSLLFGQEKTDTMHKDDQFRSWGLRMPQGLVSLCIRLNGGSFSDERILASLPRGITNLNLDLDELTDEGVKLLPPKIRQFYSSKITCNLTPACVPYYPLHLHEMSTTSYTYSRNRQVTDFQSALRTHREEIRKAIAEGLPQPYFEALDRDTQYP